MKFLLRLKHWQLFGIVWGLPILLNIFTFSDPTLLITAFPFMMIIFAFGTFGWIWAISTNLNSKLPEEVKLNVKRFKILFAIPNIYIVLIMVFMGFSFTVGNSMEGANPGAIAGIIVPLHLFSMFIIFWGVRFAAKTLKSVELGRMAKFGDYAGEFFLIWFSIIGYWVLQPRLNELVKE
ncbi:MAG: hypothetical protein ACMVP2_03815 [Imperialibacter sp.]|uniref:hypothetical protein n=1 Tax=Imperialibacter sp. TaxID=2038411 RepID=UPI003A83F1C2